MRDFVRAGGIFICTAGGDCADGSRALLSGTGAGWQALDRESQEDHFGFQFFIGTPPHLPDAQPMPLGHFKALYFRTEDYDAYVRFDAAWPVYSTAPENELLVVSQWRSTAPRIPLILVRRYGRGLVVVIGDTRFAMNRNLERIDGSPFEGQYENAVFWRYFLSLLEAGSNDSIWYPPNPNPPSDPVAKQPPLEQSPAAGEPSQSETPTDESSQVKRRLIRTTNPRPCLLRRRSKKNSKTLKNSTNRKLRRLPDARVDGHSAARLCLDVWAELLSFDQRA